MALPRGFSAPVPLGAGGEAKAYLGWQDDPGRWIVLKVAQASGRQRLKNEVDHLARLAGGPVPAVIGQDLTARSPWIGLTWIEGIPFDDLPADLPIPDRRALCIQAALAVARLHGARVVHGDLAPGNLIVRPHGEVAVLDFGLSPEVGGSTPPVVGTWEILPPERLEGGVPDPRWDVFALGVLGLRLLGALPVQLDSREAWTEVVASGEVAKWARGRSWGLSLALDPDPANRPEDAAALVRLLERDWGDPPLSRSLLQTAVDHRMERLLSQAVSQARARRDWTCAWRIQRERIERSARPEPLLAELGEFHRLRSRNPARLIPWFAGGAAMLCAIAIWVLWGRHPSDQPSELDVQTTPSPYGFADDAEVEAAPDVLVFDPPASGTVLRIDGREVPPPRDGFLRLSPGLHHVELEDSTGEPVLDTNWTVPRPAPRRPRTKLLPSSKPTPSSTRKGIP